MEESLEDRARSTLRRLAAPIVAIDASWDGDSTGWFIILSAVLEQHSESEHDRHVGVPLVRVQHGGDSRLYTGEVPPWPEAESAKHVGQRLADESRVPFHFPSPTIPDDLCASWWELGKSHACTQCGIRLIGGLRFRDDPWPWPGACEACLNQRRSAGGTELDIRISGVPATQLSWFIEQRRALTRLIAGEVGGLLRIINCLGASELWVMTVVDDLDASVGTLDAWLEERGLAARATVTARRPGEADSILIRRAQSPTPGPGTP